MLHWSRKSQIVRRVFVVSYPVIVVIFCCDANRAEFSFLSLRKGNGNKILFIHFNGLFSSTSLFFSRSFIPKLVFFKLAELFFY
jgi:hypothetical protein